MNFGLFQKPSRYTNNELNAIKKSCAPLSVALAFPDTYEVGMSHIGIKILYEIINKLPYACAERVFAPWQDYRDYIVQNSLALTSLETQTPLSAFDILGFSLQYELCFTTMLDILYLSHIPIKSEDRFDTSNEVPIVIAGGPCTVNPMPISPFIDVFFIGEAEEAIKELLELIYNCKYIHCIDREETLKEIAKINGCYVPLIHSNEHIIQRRFVKDIDTAPYPDKPIVPFMPIVHDRIAIEIARGCSMGCRFCQAGMIYRPLRFRSVDNIISIAEDTLKNTGYDEISFVSLSSGDYPYLLPLLNECRNRFVSKRIAMSLPSLRVGSVNKEALSCIKSVRKTGFTMAPEAATQRLRDVINKDFSDDDYERALDALFSEGWHNLKMYFMVGLPTETDDDVQAIKDMVMKALKIAKSKTSKFVNINVTISPFVPKPHTPFQWVGQEDIHSIQEKLKFLHDNFKSKRFNFKGHDPYASLLEAVISRGDSKLFKLILQAWQDGCRLDAWGEHFNFARWQNSANKVGIDLHSYAKKCFAKDDKLPWGHIDTLICKDYLYKEFEDALKGVKSKSCITKCSACGLKCNSNAFYTRQHYTIAQNTVTEKLSRNTLRIRCAYIRHARLKYLSHLENASALLKAIRRANIAVDFTKGFHPSPNVSFGPPLNVGVASEKEYFDMYVLEPFNLDSAKQSLAAALHKDMSLIDMQIIPLQAPSLTSFINAYKYLILLPDKADLTYNKEKLIVKRDGKEVDLTPCVVSVNSDANRIEILIKDTEDVKIRLNEFVKALTDYDLKDLEVIRTAQYRYVSDPQMHEFQLKEPL